MACLGYSEKPIQKLRHLGRLIFFAFSNDLFEEVQCGNNQSQNRDAAGNRMGSKHCELAAAVAKNCGAILSHWWGGCAAGKSSCHIGVFLMSGKRHGNSSPVSQACTCGGALRIDAVGICPYIKSAIVRLHWAGQHATLVHRKAGIYLAIFFVWRELCRKRKF